MSFKNPKGPPWHYGQKFRSVWSEDTELNRRLKVIKCITYLLSPLTENKLLKWRFRPPFFTQHPDTSTRTTENLATLVGINEAQLNYMLEVR